MRWGRAFSFLLVGLLFHAALYLAYTRPVREGHKAVRSDRAFARGPRDLDLLVCGDSHPRTGIDPRILGERVANLAIGGEHYLKTWYRMPALVELTHTTVRALMLPFDVASFSSWHADNFAPEYVWGRYVDFWEVARIEGRPFSAVERILKARLFPYAGEIRTFNQLRTKRFGFGEDLPTGQFAALPQSERRYDALQDAILHLKGADPVDPSLVWAFHNLLAWADAHQAKVVLVGFPVTDEYTRWTDKTDARARITSEVLAPLLADGNVVYLDHHDLFAGRDEFFADSNHLNTAGRVALSRRLHQELAAAGIVP